MNTDKNINVTLKSSEQTDSSDFVISFKTIFAKLRRYLLLWVIISAFFAMILTSFFITRQTNISSNSVTALVNFNYKGIESGRAPDGTKFDVNKIRSPKVIESALTDLNMSLSYVENIRRNIEIEGIVPDDVKEKQNLYNEIYLNGGSSALSAVNSLLEISGNSTYFTVRFNYGTTGLDFSESKQVLDAILKSYQDYFFTTYGYNESLGNSIVEIDYTEYDYPMAVDVFESTIDNLDDYVSNLQKETPGFRSGKTGYSFEDLNSTIDTIRSADLSALSSYIVINNVTNDKDYLISFYQYKIDELERKQNVLKSEYDMISNSIENYEKDSMIIVGESSETLDSDTYLLPSENYDKLISKKIDKQFELSKCKENIDYYEKRVAALSNSKASTTENNINETEKSLANLNEKINNLINVVNKTADEYYETVSFAHAYNILVPATGQESWTQTKDILLPIVISEVIIFVIYIFTALISAIISDSKSKESKEIVDKGESETKN